MVTMHYQNVSHWLLCLTYLAHHLVGEERNWSSYFFHTTIFLHPPHPTALHLLLVATTFTQAETAIGILDTSILTDQTQEHRTTIVTAIATAISPAVTSDSGTTPQDTGLTPTATTTEASISNSNSNLRNLL